MTEQQFNAGVLGAFAAIGVACLVAWIVHEVRKGPKKNIRVPRETLWARTNRYHGSKP